MQICKVKLSECCEKAAKRNCDYSFSLLPMPTYSELPESKSLYDFYAGALEVEKLNCDNDHSKPLSALQGDEICLLLGESMNRHAAMGRKKIPLST